MHLTKIFKFDEKIVSVGQEKKLKQEGKFLLNPFESM